MYLCISWDLLFFNKKTSLYLPPSLPDSLTAWQSFIPHLFYNAPATENVNAKCFVWVCVCVNWSYYCERRSDEVKHSLYMMCSDSLHPNKMKIVFPEVHQKNSTEYRIGAALCTTSNLTVATVQLRIVCWDCQRTTTWQKAFLCDTHTHTMAKTRRAFEFRHVWKWTFY